MVYREGVIGESKTRKWFAKFKNGNFDIDDMACSGRPSEFDKYLYSMGFAKKLGVWVSHEPSENNKENRLQIASQHFACQQATCGHKQHFLYRIVMGDEKWCLCINMKQKKE